MRGTTSMNIGACVGLKETLDTNRSDANNDRYPLNKFIGKSFFNGENYRAALERLDGGYEVSMEFIEWMQDYCDNELEQAGSLMSYTEKWITRLRQQSSIASYHTTKRAQLDVIRVGKEVAQVKQSKCRDSQSVIDRYRKHVDETYITERFRPGRKHYRSNELKKLFKTAYASLREVSDEIDLLTTQEKKARDNLRATDSAREIVELDPTTTEKQRARAIEDQTKKRMKLNDIESKLVEKREIHKSAQKTYRKEAKEIFKQCQYIEEQRLEQIRETLLDFIQTMHTTKFSTELSEIFQNLTTKVTTQQNSFDDLLFWAKTYGIEDKLTKSLKLTSNDDGDDENNKTIELRTTKKVSNQQDDEESSSATPVKSKLKRTKNTTNEKTN